jgi:hypothetical protein
MVMESDLKRWLRLVEVKEAQTVEVDGVLRPTRNSEGKLIAPTADALAAFWQWFGKSKVVDVHGLPLVVHRGDKPGNAAFTGEHLGNYIQGNIFFSSERDIAKGYTPHRTNSYLASSDMNQSHGLYSAYLRIVRPVVVDAKGADWSRIPVSGRLKKAIGGYGAIQIDDLALHVQKNTQSDGLIVKNVWDQFGDGVQFVVFSGQQIKLLPSAPIRKKKVVKPKEEPFRPVSYQWDDATQDYVEVADSDPES